MNNIATVTLHLEKAADIQVGELWGRELPISCTEDKVRVVTGAGTLLMTQEYARALSIELNAYLAAGARATKVAG